MQEQYLSEQEVDQSFNDDSRSNKQFQGAAYINMKQYYSVKGVSAPGNQATGDSSSILQAGHSSGVMQQMIVDEL